MKITRFAALLCLIATFAVFSLQAKSPESVGKCRVLSLKEAYQDSKAVFVGEIIKVVEDGDVKTFTFRVEKNWKGADKEEIEINARQTMRYQAWFEVGEKYLVYARGSEKDDKLWEKRCSRSKRLADAAEDIAELERAKESINK